MSKSNDYTNTYHPDVPEPPAEVQGVALRSFELGQQSLDSASAAVDNSTMIRSSFLRRASATVFATTAALLLPNAPEAVAESAAPCGGYPLCGGGCCGDKKCDAHCAGGWLGCRTGEQCWFMCTNANKKIKCCDCVRNEPFDYCICRFNVGTCQ